MYYYFSYTSFITVLELIALKYTKLISTKIEIGIGPFPVYGPTILFFAHVFTDGFLKTV